MSRGEKPRSAQRAQSLGLCPRYLILCFVFVSLVAGCGPGAHEFGGTVLEPPQPVPDFTLTSASGPVSLSDFAGQYVFLYFGYTFCPDVCPATLAELARVRRELGAEAERVQVIMVTVDPERDTAVHLADYVSHFDPAFVGLSGSNVEIDAVGAPYGLYYERHEGTAATGYLVDHTARAFLIDPQRRARVAYPFDTGAQAITADLRWLMTQE